MNKDISEIKELLTTLLNSSNFKIDKNQEKKFYYLVEKINNSKEKLNMKEEKINIELKEINLLINQLIIKQNKNKALFEEFKKIIEKNKLNSSN